MKRLLHVEVYSNRKIKREKRPLQRRLWHDPDGVVDKAIRDEEHEELLELIRANEDIHRLQQQIVR